MYENYTINNVKLDEVDKILNDYFSIYNRKFDVSFNCEFKTEVDNNFKINIKTNYVLNIESEKIKKVVYYTILIVWN